MNASLPITAASARLPGTYIAAKTALAECQQVDECKSWADKAAALASYAKQAKDDELEKMAQRIRARAIRRAGELLQQVDGRGRPSENKAVDLPNYSQRDAARDVGFSEHQVKTAVRIANVPEQEFERQVESPKPATLSALAEQGIKPRPAPSPDPQTWLKGRDPAAFNLAMRFAGLIEDYAKELWGWDLDSVLPHLSETEARDVRANIAAVDAIHDRIVTRI